MYAESKRRLSNAVLPATLAISLALTGCAPSPTAPVGATDNASVAPRPTSSATDSADADQHDEEDDHPSVPVPEAGEASQADAITAAQAVVTAFARPNLDEAQWWTELVPLLSQKGAVAYEGTLPSNIPVTAVTGTAAVLPASTDVATLVEVPTDAGPYIVTLVRGGTDEPWLAERIRPAGE